MYRIYVDGNVFCDSTDGSTAIINPVVKLKANYAGSMTFVIPPEHPHYVDIKRKKSIIEVYRGDEQSPIFSGICSEETIDFYKQKKVVCEGDLAFLNDSVLRPHRYTGETVYSLLEAYIREHNSQVDNYKQFELGTVTVTDPNNYISCFTNMNPTMQEIKEDLLDDLGGYIRVRHEGRTKYIDYLAESPRIAAQTIELGKNLIDYSSNIDSTEIATRVIPLGATLEESAVPGLDTRLTIESVNGGLDYLESPLVAEYGITTATVTFDNVTTASNLKLKGQKYLSDIQFENVTISASAIDLGYVEDVSNFRLLDSVHVISEPHGMDRVFVITEMTLNLNDPDKDVYKLGSNQKLSLTAKTQNTNTELVRQIEKAADKSGVVESAVKRVTSMISGAEGGSVVTRYDDDGRPYEMLILDTDSIETAKNVWRWNINGLGFSKNGINGPFGLAMTSSGEIVADFITTGTLDADKATIKNLKAENVFVSSGGTVDIALQDLQKQVDGSMELIYTDYAPTKENYPYWDWTGMYANDGEDIPEEVRQYDPSKPVYYASDDLYFPYTDEELQKHVRTMVFDQANLMTYRFVKIDGQFVWQELADTETAVILSRLTQVEAKADGVQSTVEQISLDLDDNYWNKTETQTQINQKADSITSEVASTYSTKSEALSLASRIAQTNSAITAEVSRAVNAELAISGKVELKIDKDDNNQIVSMLNASANVIDIQSNRLKVKSDNFTLGENGHIWGKGVDLDGSMNMTGGKIDIQGDGGNSGAFVRNTAISAKPYTAIGGGVISVSGESGYGTTQIERGSIHVLGGTKSSWYDANRAYVDGAVTASAYNTSSDERLKENVKDIDCGKSAKMIYALSPKTFTYKNDEEMVIHHGLIAQEAMQSMYDDSGIVNVQNGFYAIAYQELIADLIATVKSQNERIKALEKAMQKGRN